MCYYNWPAEDTALQVPLEPDAATLDVARADNEIRLALPALPQANTAEGQHYLRPTLSNPRRPANTASCQHCLRPTLPNPQTPPSVFALLSSKTKTLPYFGFGKKR